MTTFWKNTMNSFYSTQNHIQPMIATHSVKVFDSRLLQEPLRTKLLPIPQELQLFASHLLPVKYFACPTNFENFENLVHTAHEANDANLSLNDTGAFYPDIQDGRLCQLIVPFNEACIAVTPTPNLNIMDKLNKADLNFYDIRKVQPAFRSSHLNSEVIFNSKGTVKLLKTRLHGNQFSGINNGSHVLLEADIHDVNISSFYVSTGIPALTGIGGAVNVIERDTGLKLKFAVGFRNLHFTGQESQQMNYLRGKVRSTGSRPHEGSLSATGRIALILTCRNQDEADLIMASLYNINRICSGTLTNVHIRCTNEIPRYHWYSVYKEQTLASWDDYIQTAQAPCTFESNRALVQNGFALLSEPELKRLGRNNPHAWAESTFKMIELNKAPDLFELKQVNNLVYWDAV